MDFEKDDWYPLSAVQRSLWFEYKTRPETSGRRNMSFCIRVLGQLDAGTLERALNTLAARHSMLLTKFCEFDGTPRQSVDRHAAIRVTVFDDAVSDDEIGRRVAEETVKPFDLTVAPLVRGCIYRRGAGESILLVLFDHLICDGWSFWRVIDDLGKILEGRKSDPGEPICQAGPPEFFSCVEEQEAWLESRTAARQLRYWSSALGSESSVLDLPTDFPRSENTALDTENTKIVLSGKFRDGLRQLAKRRGVTLYVVLLAAYLAVLHRVSGQDSVAVGSPVPARGGRRWSDVTGPFVNFVTLRAEFPPQLTLRDLIGQVQTVAFRALRNQDYPFNELIRRLNPSRTHDRAPYFQNLFVFHNAREAGSLGPLLVAEVNSKEGLADAVRRENRPDAGDGAACGVRPEAAPVRSQADDGGEPAIAWGGFEVAGWRDPPEGDVSFDLTLKMLETERCIFAGLYYSPTLFERNTAERWSSYWVRLLEAMVADDGEIVDRVELLDSMERRRVVEDWNATAAAWPKDRCIHELFEARVAEAPEAVALVSQQQSLSYGELNAQANRLAHYLRGLGVRPDAPVAISLERSLAMVVALFAVLKSGAAYVPLDPSYPRERLSWMLGDGAPVAVLSDAAGRAALAGLSEDVPVIDVGDAVVWAQESALNPVRANGLTSRNLAYVIYTSGSTGAPKGVMVEHRGLTNMVGAQNVLFAMTRESRMLQFSSFSFDACASEIFMALCTGASLCIPPHGLLAGAALVEVVRRFDVSHALLPPAVLASLPEGCTLDPVTTLIVAGDASSVELTRRWATAGRRYINAYGPTEASICAAMHPCSGAERGSPPIGRAITNTKIYILDRLGAPVPVGVVGEIHIGGAGVGRGYLNRPDLSAERFVADPFAPEAGARMYRSGDLGRWRSDGTIEYRGRNDFQVKIRGFRVELGEIETRLRQQSGVREVAVIAREDSPGNKRLVAYYVGDAAARAETLRAHLTGRVPDYMVPAAFVRLEALPLTRNGKLDREALPVPLPDAGAAACFEAPSGDVENMLAKLWAELLQIGQVSRYDNFFSLGGHSLLAITLIERLRQQGLRADVRTLFAAPTLARLAELMLREDSGAEIPPNRIAAGCGEITPDMLPLVRLSQAEIAGIAARVPGGAANIQDIYPLAPLQEGVLFHYLMSGDADAYLTRSLLAFDSRARLDRFVAALEDVIDRHDILRSSVQWEGLPEPVQVVWRRAPLVVEEVVLDAGPDDAAGELRGRFDPRHTRLDLRQAPLLRLVVAADEGRRRFLLLLLHHHLVMDHTTLELVGREVAAHVAGRAADLPPPVPYRNFVAQARCGAGVAEHEAFFRDLLGDVDEPTAPFGLLDTQGDGSEIEEARLGLEKSLSRRVRERARALGVSVASLFHLAWGVVAARTSGRASAVFGTVLFGRMQGDAGADRAIGMLINTLPLRVDVGEESVADSVRCVHELLTQLLRHEHAPLTLAQACSAVPAPMPLFSSLLNYRHSAGGEAQSFAGFEGVEILSAEERSNFPLALSVEDHGEGFELTAQAPVEIGALRLCGLMKTAVSGVVEALEQGGGSALASIGIVGAEERARVVEDWNATARAFPDHSCIHALFEAQVARSPDSVAVVGPATQVSYAELNRRANILAHHLMECGVRAGAHVVLLLERSSELVVAELAVLKCGAAYVPIDASFPHSRQAFMIGDCAAEFVLTLAGRALPSGVRAARVDVDTVCASAAACEDLRLPVDSASSAYVMYTSGSTGTPKGVVISHRAIGRLVLNNGYTEFGPCDRVAFAANPAFDASTMEVWGPLLSGGAIVIVGQDTLLDPERFAALLKREAVSVMFLTTALFNACAAVPGIFSSLRVLLTGGERCDVAVFRRMLAGGGPRHLIHCYGPTETTTFALTHEVVAVEEGAQTIPLGRPIANTTVYVLDSRCNPVPAGVCGELYIGGAGVANGYLNQPDLTAERFIADPFARQGGARMYKTGDLGRWRRDGTIEFLGRNDFQVKIRGFRIELEEIEARLKEQADLREVAVMARQDTPGETRLVAYYTADSDLGADCLRAHITGRLPDYMVPAAFVQLEALPLTRNGKIDRDALPLPGMDAYAARGSEPPVGELEEKLAALWSELLRIGHVSRHDNFFALGGHSLLAVQLVARLRQALGIEVQLSQIFAHPVLADLAVVLKLAPVTTLPPVVAEPREGAVLPLSFAQARLWFLAQLEGASAAYHISGGLRLKGALDRSALVSALNRIVARHEALRTTFVLQGDVAVQRVAPADIGFALWMQDLESLAAPEEALARLAAEEARQAFDLERGPLIRGRLLRVAEDDHVLLVTMHHIVSDGWSMAVLTRELSALYAASVRGEDDPLPPLCVQYADYAMWQRRYLAGPLLQRQAAYWKEALAGAPALLTLPSDHERPLEPDYAGASVEVRLGAELSRSLQELSLRAGMTLHMTLLAAFALLLARLSGQDEVVIGSPVANRQRAEIADLIGFFVNTVALRIDTSGSPSLRQLLERTKAVSLADQENQDLPFEQVVEIVQPPRRTSHTPVFQAMFAWQNTPVGELALPGLQVTPLEIGSGTAQFDLTLSLAQAGDEITGQLTYATALFARDTVTRWLGSWLRLLEAMVADEAQIGDRVDMLDAEERRRVLRDWNATEAPYPDDKCLHELFEEQVARSPDAVAVIGPGGELSYGELNARANRLAHYLRRRGVRPDDRVAIAVERSVAMVVAMLAVLKAGGAYVPLDPSYPAERLVHMLADCGPVALLSDAAGWAALAGQLIDVLVIDIDDDAAWAQGCACNPERAPGLTPRHLAYVIYTSGSTGTPKGAMVEHRGLCNMATAHFRLFRVTPDTRMLQFSSFSFDACAAETFTTLCVGGALCIPPPGVLAGAALAEVVARWNISHLVLTPAVLGSLPEGCTLDSVTTLIVAGDASTVELIRRWATSGRHYVNAYGPTETAISSSVWECRAEDGGNPPIGHPVPNVQAYILDRFGAPVPVGVAGEIHIGGVGVGRGYLNRPDLSAERFVADPFGREPGARMYRTGDLGRWRGDGAIEYLGRNDFQVKIRGFRIELGEIEARLKDHSSVREAAVIAREDTQGDRRLVAYYVGDAGASADCLREHLSGRLPDYMVPAAFVQLEALPLTRNGKLDRDALPLPGTDAYAARCSEPPVGALEEKLAALWSELLRIDGVSRHDNFFALGGHSLLAVQLAARLRQALGIEVQLSQIFAHPVLADLARALNLAPVTTLPPVVAERREGTVLPLSFAQARLWFLAQFEGASAAYHMPGGLRLKGALDHGALVQALNRIVARHEALRTTFAVQDGEPVQRVAPSDSGFAVRMQDLEGVADAEAALARLATEEAKQAFDLERGPLIRGRLLRMAEHDHVLLVTMHHIVSDGWSMAVLTRELSALYAACVRGEEDPLPPLVVQYADYAIWQRRFLAGEVLQRQAAWWKEALAGAPVLLTLPLDHERPPEPDYAGASVGVRLGAELSRGLKDLSLRAGMTLHMTLSAGFALLLARLSGQDEVVIGSPVANRQRAEIADLIGFFVNTVALRIDTSGSPTLRQLLARAKAVSLAAQENQDLPFEQVVEIVQPPRRTSHTPVFQAMFAWQNTPGTELSLPGLCVRSMEGPGGTAQFDLTLSLAQTGDEITGHLTYATALFDRETVTRWLAFLLRLLEAMVADDTQIADRVDLLGAEERRRIVEDWNDTAAVWPEDSCLHELFEAQVSHAPDAVAVVVPGGDLSYGELNARANRLAHYLRAGGVGPDERVAISVERGVAMVVAMLAVLKAGGAYVPLDPSYPQARLFHMLADCGPVALLSDAAGRAALAGQRIDIPVIAIDDDAPWAQESACNPKRASGLTPRHLAYVIYTSGSTGTPKGAMVEHRGLSNMATAQNRLFRVMPGSRLFQFSSFSFDSCASETFTTLCAGGTLCIPPPGVLAGAALAEVVVRWNVSHLVLTPAVLASLPQDCTLDSVTTLVVVGDASTVELTRRWATSGRRYVNAYGPTETSICASMGECRAEDGGNPPIGRPIANVQIHILDRYGAPVPAGVAGEIHIGGVGVGRGYLNRPDLSAERFVADPFAPEPGARMYRTGDLGRWRSDGTIEYLGRNDFQVKIRGFRIELGEIEARLKDHAGVCEAAVIAREDAPGDRRLVAYYVGEAATRVEDLRDHLSGRLPDYMVPTAFVRLEALPLTPNGKLDRDALPLPTQDACSARAFEPPVGEVEEMLAALWSELLKIDPVSRHDDFFALGGHSLLAITLIERLRQQGFEADLRVLFAAPTLARLAASLAQSAVETYVELSETAILPEDIQPLPATPAGRPSRFLLTGATGLVGRFLLRELLDQGAERVICLSRDADSKAGLERLRETLKRWSLWRAGDGERIEVLAGDLGAARLGLSAADFGRACDEVDAIFHAATSMNHLESFESARKANVEGVNEILRIVARGRPKTLHYLSTMAVFSAEGHEGLRHVDETTPIDAERHPWANGYAASKWVGEQLVHLAGRRGLPCNVFRLGLITGDSELGRYDEAQAFHRLLESAIRIGGGFTGVRYDPVITPVDYVVRALVRLGRDHAEGGGVFHLSSQVVTPIEDVFVFYNQVAEPALQLLPPREWLTRIRERSEAGETLPIMPLVHSFLDMDEPTLEAHWAARERSGLRFDCARSCNELESAGVVMPPFNAELMGVYVRGMLAANPALRELVKMRSEGDGAVAIWNGSPDREPIGDSIGIAGVLEEELTE
ncbi:MAG: amino acid adenylation domain-containing protein [Alphaproteobacteria bacterium]|nr:amino acid adenylation domain-containing protein [Alphaproteobacteria bacterium]